MNKQNKDSQVLVDIERSRFFQQLHSATANKTLIRLTLSKAKDKSEEKPNKIIIKPVTIKKAYKLSFVYRYKTKDITKNFEIAESLKLITKYWEEEFDIINLFTSAADWSLSNNQGKPKLSKSKASFEMPKEFTHDNIKNKAGAKDQYLLKLGIIKENGKPNTAQGDKLKQIRKYTEILDHQLQKSGLYNKEQLSLVDMGCGRGYLSFALMDHLMNNYKGQINFTGIEMREGLVKESNGIAKDIGFDGLNFKCMSIQEFTPDKLDVLIALHACDTATDDAILKGIEAKAQLIIVAPCCHKQVRQTMIPSNTISEITKHGILLERQAEIATDAIRALILEREGYEAKVFEFISNEHTSKNLMIVANRLEKEKVASRTAVQKKIDNLKELIGLEYHYLERIVKHPQND